LVERFERAPNPSIVGYLTGYEFLRDEAEKGTFESWDTEITEVRPSEINIPLPGLFREMRVRPTRDTMFIAVLKSWVVGSSLDGVEWTEIDRKTDTLLYYALSFPFANSTECRFIRLTQTGENQ
jgi:hypothetical protein